MFAEFDEWKSVVCNPGTVILGLTTEIKDLKSAKKGETCPLNTGVVAVILLYVVILKLLKKSVQNVKSVVIKERSK